MTERINKFSADLKRLLVEGNELHMAIQHEFHGKSFEDRLQKLFNNDQVKIQKYLKALPSFKQDYQRWYSESQALIKQVLPDRFSDFTSYYEYPRVRKNTNFQNYRIRDYLQGLRITSWDSETIVDGSAAIPEFVQQLNIVKAARDTLESTILNLKAVLQADLFDSEIDSAWALAKAGYLRAAGAICGVVIEKHLDHIRESHNKKITKKNPGISDLAQLLRLSNVITLAQERFIQSLADTRNLCSHAKGREPSQEEITELVEGTSKILKTIF